MAGPPMEGFDWSDHHPTREYVVATNTGIRNWYIIDTSRPLRSMTYPFYWEGRGPHRARHADHMDANTWREAHPQIGNPVGFYAYYDPTVDDYAGYDFRAAFRIPGLIEGYGRSVIGTLGFRSEVAVILAFTLEGARRVDEYQFPSLLTDDEHETVLWYLDKFYPSVPVYETRAEMFKMFPLSEKPYFTRYGPDETV